MSLGVYIGIPTYDGKIHWSTAAGLAQVARFTGAKGIGFAIDVIPGDAFISKARNTIVQRFLTQSDFDDLIFIDADVGFTIKGFQQLMTADADIAMGLYRVKDDRIKYPALLHDPIQPHPKDPRLVKLQYGPAGFMRVRRKVFEAMIAKWPDEFYYAGEAKDSKMHDIFPAGRKDHHFTGEDISFCERAIACGFDIWAVQDVELDHTGLKTYDAKWRVLHAVEEAA